MPIYMAKGNKKMDNKTKFILSIATLLLFGGCTQDSKKSEQSVSSEGIKITQNAVKVRVDTKDKSNSGQFYYSYNSKEKSEQDPQEKVRTTLDAYLNIRSPYERIQVEMMIHKLSHDFIIKCSPCHDDYANGVIGPSLLGKDANFIYERIMDFKNGKKKNILMRDLVTKIDDSKLKQIAQEIAEFNQQLLQMRKGKK